MPEKWKFCNRYDPYTMITGDSDEFPTDPKGSLFESGTGLHDLSHIHVLSSTVDTVKQIYHGVIKLKWLEKIERFLDSNEEFLSDGPYGPWHISRIGKSSGYQLKLQNNELGFVILLKTVYAKHDKPASHLKIEVSPHRIRSSGSCGALQGNLDSIAIWLLEEGWKYVGVAVHLAVDVQGWKPKMDFMQKLVTRTRTTKDFRGISDFQLDNLSEISTVYDNGQSFLFGKASALQMAVYRKDLEISKRDKVDYFHDVWNKDGKDWFESDKCVWRIEVRLHHGIMREIGLGLGGKIESFRESESVLTDVWRYGLDRNRLMLTERYIDPFWQLLMQDVQFCLPPSGVAVRRVKKKDMSNAGKNVAMMIGNIVTLAARRQMDAFQIVHMIQDMALYEDVRDYLKSKGYREGRLFEMVERGLKIRRLLGKAA
ncbi:MAG: hypothetical protein HQL89_04050 [Magnetococcales bacterium]|nr:hypothetical protein [Magnetococcales bacterium]